MKKKKYKEHDHQKTNKKEAKTKTPKYRTPPLQTLMGISYTKINLYTPFTVDQVQHQSLRQRYSNSTSDPPARCCKPTRDTPAATHARCRHGLGMTRACPRLPSLHGQAGQGRVGSGRVWWAGGQQAPLR